MGNDGYHSASHCKYLVQYHIIWCPKFRFDVLEGDVEAELKSILECICMKYGYAIKALEVMSDHVHIFVDCPQTVAPCDVVRTLKSISAVEMGGDAQGFPEAEEVLFEMRCPVVQGIFHLIGGTCERGDGEEIHRGAEEWEVMS